MLFLKIISVKFFSIKEIVYNLGIENHPVSMQFDQVSDHFKFILSETIFNSYCEPRGRFLIYGSGGIRIELLHNRLGKPL